MTKQHKHDKKNDDKKVNEEIKDIINETDIIEELDEAIEESKEKTCNSDYDKLKEAFARQQADYDNFKKRVERDREDMIFYLKSDVLKKILPRLDDLQRIIAGTPEDLRTWSMYDWIVSIEKKLVSDLERLWVKHFESKWKEVDPDKHEVMTQIPWKNWIILDEFEKWYMIGDRVLRVAKVVVGQE